MLVFQRETEGFLQKSCWRFSENSEGRVSTLRLEQAEEPDELSLGEPCNDAEFYLTSNGKAFNSVRE